MAVYDMPDEEFNSLNLRLITPQQVTRSGYTGRRQVMSNPWHGRWAIEAEHVPIIGEANFRPWRAFLAKLRGQEHTFRYPVTEGEQHDPFEFAFAITNAANTTVSSTGGEAGEARIEKTGGVAATWDASATSAAGSAGGELILRIRPQTVDKDMHFGLSVTPATNNSYESINIAWDFTSAGTARPYELNTPLGSASAYLVGQYFFIHVTAAGAVSFWRGTSSDFDLATLVLNGTANTNDLHFDSSIQDSGGKADVLFKETVSEPRVASGGAAGATTLTLETSVPLTAGMFATVPLDAGGYQLVQLTADIVAAVITFEPPLRGAADIGGKVVTIEPYVIVAQDESETGYNVVSGPLYSLVLSGTEAF